MFFKPSLKISDKPPVIIFIVFLFNNCPYILFIIALFIILFGYGFIFIFGGNGKYLIYYYLFLGPLI